MKFEEAIEYVLKWEGDYSNDPDDRGGATRWGISQRAHPTLDIKNLTKEQAIEIYRKEYWDKYNFAKIPIEFQQKLFDMTVNMGFETSILLLQRAMNTILKVQLKEDGVLGDKTYAALKDVCQHWGYMYGTICSLKSECASYYRVIAAKNTSQEKFLAGWLRRAYS